MDGNKNLIVNDCSMAGVRPIMVDLPYPPVQVKCQNETYAKRLSVDYCGSVSELSAILQYVNNENRIACRKCSLTRTILGLAMAEMMHLQKLGELIQLLGGTVGFTTDQQNGKSVLWSPSYLVLPESIPKMLCADIEAEKAAIKQYRMHISVIQDEYINAVLARIIKDEEYHIMILKSLLENRCE